jgi:hypothetical protein
MVFSYCGGFIFYLVVSFWEVNMMKNRYGDEYDFVLVADNTFQIIGDLKYWRFGGREGQEKMDFTDLGFVDPSGGPFIEVGMLVKGYRVKRIRAEDDNIFFEVENV